MDRTTVLLVSNSRPDEVGGRAEKIATRCRLFGERGYDIEIAYVPEPYIPTAPLTLSRVLRRARSVDPDVVLSISNPFHLHTYGFAASRAAGAPWIAEFRDPILTHPDWQGDSPMRSVAAAVERLAARHADRVVWLDGIQMADGYLAETYPDCPVGRFVKLPFMGYDSRGFDDVEPRTEEGFTITYAGSFYEGWIEPYGFLEGLGAVVADGDPIRAHFYGDWNDDYQWAAESAGVADEIVTHGFVPHEDVVPALVGSDALLYVGGDDPDNRLNVPSKMYDYIGARTPILAVVDPDFRVAALIQEHGIGVVAPPDDPAAIADAIERLYTGAFSYDPDPQMFDQFTRERHVEAYLDVVDDVLAQR